MPYIEDVCQPLIDTLTHSTGLPIYQLAGHVANIDFWMTEIKHALGLIDGYEERFNRLVTAQQAFDASDPDFEARKFRDHQDRPICMSMTETARGRLRERVVSIAKRLLDRCLREGLIDLETSDRLRDVAMRN